MGLMGVALVLTVVAVIVHRPLLPGVWHDDGAYLLLARALAEGRGYVWGGVPGDPPGAKFPPGFPGFLALVWNGTGGLLSATARISVLVNLGAVVGAGVALARFGLRHLGLPLPWALLAGVLSGLLVDPWRHALAPLSESLGLLFGVLVLDAATRVERAPPGRGRGPGLLFLGLFAGAFHLRSALLPLGVGGVVGAALKGGRRRGGAMAAGVLVVVAPWMILSGRWTARLPPEFRDLLGGYGPWLRDLAMRTPEVLFGGVGRRAVRTVGELGGGLFPGLPGAGQWVLALLLMPLLVAGVGLLWRQSGSASVALGLLLVQTVLWPFVDRRLVFPLLPWIVLLTVAGAWSLGGRARPRPLLESPWGAGGRGSRIASGGILSVWSVLLLVGLVRAAGGPGGVAGPGTVGREMALQAAVAAIQDRVPPGRVVGAPEFWAIVHLRTGHPVVPSVRFRPGSGLAAVGSPGELHRLWAVGRVGTLLDEGGLHRAGLEALDAVCGPSAWAIVATGPGFQLVDLTWDVECRRRLIPGWEEAPGPVSPR